MWLHGSLGHLAMNLFSLWMFGSPLAHGLGCAALPALLPGLRRRRGLPDRELALPRGRARRQRRPRSLWAITLGASGAIYGVLLAYSLTWPDRTIMLIFPPVAFRAIWLIPGLFFMTLMMDPGGNVSHVGHLGGVLVGWLYLRSAAATRGQSASRSRSSSTAGAASACASSCAPSGTTTSRRGAAATTIGRCTEAMTHPTPSPDFAISAAARRARSRARPS